MLRDPVWQFVSAAVATLALLLYAYVERESIFIDGVPFLTVVYGIALFAGLLLALWFERNRVSSDHSALFQIVTGYVVGGLTVAGANALLGTAGVALVALALVAASVAALGDTRLGDYRPLLVGVLVSAIVAATVMLSAGGRGTTPPRLSRLPHPVAHDPGPPSPNFMQGTATLRMQLVRQEVHAVQYACAF